MQVTFKGQTMALEGPDLKVGDKAPDFTLANGEMKTVTLDGVIENGKKNALLIVVPSLDTGVCSLESQKFNTRIAEFPADVVPYVVSRDLPFAQARWVKEEGDVKLRMLSDFRDHSFGPAYGVLAKDLGLLARSVFIIGKDKRIKYKQLVPEIAQEPNYDDVIAAASMATSAGNA
jgi:thiol peroxidase